MSESGTVSRLRAAGCVFAEDEERLLVTAAKTSPELAAMVERRVAGDPLEQILGWSEFCGRRVAVEPGVFVPRRRTEFLVHQAVALATAGDVVVDLFCGSGAVGAALAAEVEHCELYAADIDLVAVRCAQINIEEAGGVAYTGDLFDALPQTLRGRVRILVANAPYVPTDAIGSMPPEARIHEPQAALDGGTDGLDFHRRVAVSAPQWLAPDGHLLIETSEEQAPQTAEAVESHGLVARITRSAELDATVVVASRHS